MKITKIILFIMTAICLSLSAVSCGDDYDKEDFSLVGKIYSTCIGGVANPDGGYLIYRVFQFKSATEVEVAIRQEITGENLYTPNTYTYELKYPNITFVTQENDTITGTFYNKSYFKLDTHGPDYIYELYEQ